MKSLLNTLHRFKEIDPVMQISTVLTLLEIARADSEDREVSTRDIEELVGLTSGATSRNIAYWAGGSNYMKGSHGYVNVGFHSQDRRLRSLTLTPKGRAFLKRLFGED